MNKHRLILGICCCLLPIIILICVRKDVFYIIPSLDFNIYRWFWTMLCSWFGFGVLILKNIPQNQSDPSLDYYTYYPVLLVVISSIVFSILHLFPQTSNFIFYYLSFSLCFIFGYMVDYFWKIIFTTVEAFQKK